MVGIRGWYSRFDNWLRSRGQQHVEGESYKRREKALYDSTAAIGRAQGWDPKPSESKTDDL